MIKKYEIIIDDSNPTDLSIVGEDLLYHFVKTDDATSFHGLQCNHISDGTDTDQYARVLEMCDKIKDYVYAVEFFNDKNMLNELKQEN